uniref:Uncharacterized protein n=1 Tax=Nelumbo nucifera TaxID=4432 RepID=A0A822YD11_NELNU|nr:TPA_asm: hypothetical protein HUJ06_009321 [Nelumbo nucifera]
MHASTHTPPTGIAEQQASLSLSLVHQIYWSPNLDLLGQGRSSVEGCL